MDSLETIEVDTLVLTVWSVDSSLISLNTIGFGQAPEPLV